MGRRKWYNDLARDTRDIQYLKKVYGAKTPEERARRIGCIKTLIMAVLVLIAGCLLLSILSAIFSGCTPLKVALPTPTPEMLIVRRAMAEQPTPEMLIVRRTYPTREPTNTPYIAPIVYTVTAMAYLPTATPTVYIPKAYYSAPVAANTNVNANVCLNIIGNVNGNNGDKIYHCSNWRDYNKIKMNTAEGDRYFCTEAEARAAGFRAPEYSHGACR